MNHQNNNNNNNGMNQNGYGFTQPEYSAPMPPQMQSAPVSPNQAQQDALAHQSQGQIPQAFPAYNQAPQAFPAQQPADTYPAQPFPAQTNAYHQQPNASYGTDWASQQGGGQQPVQSQFAQPSTQPNAQQYSQGGVYGQGAPHDQNPAYGQNGAYNSGFSPYGGNNSGGGNGKKLWIGIAICAVVVIAIAAVGVFLVSSSFGNNAESGANPEQSATSPSPAPTPKASDGAATTPKSSSGSAESSYSDKNFCNVVKAKMNDLVSISSDMANMGDGDTSGVAASKAKAESVFKKLSKLYREIGDSASAADKQIFYHGADGIDRVLNMMNNDPAQLLKEMETMRKDLDAVGAKIRVSLAKCSGL